MFQINRHTYDYPQKTEREEKNAEFIPYSLPVTTFSIFALERAKQHTVLAGTMEEWA